MAQVTRSNPKAFEALEAKLKELAGGPSKGGWVEAGKDEGGTPGAYVASIQEYGHGPIPPRSFFRPTAMKEKPAWADIAAQGAKAVLKGSVSARDVMDGLGERAQEDVKETINQITSPPLSPITLELRA